MSNFLSHPSIAGGLPRINYDYLTYTSILGSEISEIYDIKDGFKGSSPVELKCIEDRLNGTFTQKKIERPFLFLHGAFHIFQKRDNKYYKIVRDKDSFLKNIQNKYKEITDDIDHMLDQKSETQDNPILVFFAKSRDKLSAIEENSYLTYGLERLTQEVKIFTFGCSFELDSHILDAIFKEEDGKNKKVKAYIGCFSDADKKIIREYVRDKDVCSEYVMIVDLSEEKCISEVVWS